jgi:hypothetical protein
LLTERIGWIPWARLTRREIHLVKIPRRAGNISQGGVAAGTWPGDGSLASRASR